MFRLTYPKFWNRKGFLSWLLLPLSLAYYFGTIARKLLARQVRFKAKVICAGNATIGGTGKTQVVITIAKFLGRKGTRFVMVTKGYGSRLKGATIVTDEHAAEQVGDEGVILRKYGTVIAATRACDILPLIERLQPEVILFDDGLQNPNFHKDFSILVIDATRGFGNGFLIPAGPLRQKPLDAMSESGAIVITGKGHVNLATDIPIFRAVIKSNFRVERDRKYLAFSGLGNNQRFFDSLKEHGADVAETVSFPDHYNYSDEDILRLKAQAGLRNLSMITTEKDYVKIQDKRDIECFEVELVIDNKQTLEKLIDEKITKTV